MFLQICLLTAGVHYGCRLYEQWRAADTAPPVAAEPLAVPAPASPGTEASTEASSPPPEAEHPEEAAVDEQLDLALVSTGLTLAASTVLPQLRIIGGASVLYGGIPAFQKARELIVEERRVGIEVLDSIGLVAAVAARQYAVSAVMLLIYATAQRIRIRMEKELRRSMLEERRRYPDGAGVAAPGEPTEAAEIAGIWQRSADFSTSSELSGKRIADASVLPILALSALAFPRVGVQGTATLLNIGVADDLRVSAPLSMLRTVHEAYHAGILVKDGRSLQTLPDVDTVVLDQDAVRLPGQRRLHPEVRGVIGALHRRGLKLYLLSADHEGKARATAERFGFDGYFAGVRAAEKAQTIESLRGQGRTVCFVGDGIADAVALGKAAVSVSLRGASGAAMDGAQVTLLEEGIGNLPALFVISADLQRNMDGILLSAVIPAVVSAGGLLNARFTTSALVMVYAASLASGMTIALWPREGERLARERGRAGELRVVDAV